MRRFGVIAAAMAIVALPAGVFGGPTNEKPLKVDKEKTEKSAPAPAALVLVGVAAGVAGLVRHRERRRRMTSGTP